MTLRLLLVKVFLVCLTGSTVAQLIGDADNGADGITTVLELRPDVVLMDLKMPIMDGLEATRLIKSQWPEIRVIILTMCAEYQARAIAAAATAAPMETQNHQRL